MIEAIALETIAWIGIQGSFKLQILLLFKVGSHCEVQAGLECLSLPPSSASPITGVYYHIQLHISVKLCCLDLCRTLGLSPTHDSPALES